MQVGFKLLAADVKIASRLGRRVLQGKNLSRYATPAVECMRLFHVYSIRHAIMLSE